MRKEIKWRGIVLVGLALSFMLLGTACDPSDTAVQTAMNDLADEMMTVEPTVFAPTDIPEPTNTPEPTETPVPPTDTPVPTPTEVKVSMMDEEGDCEVVTGGLGEEGCQVDLASVTLLPCENPSFYTFKVEFHTLQDPNTINICFLINEDGNLDTGFEADGFLGIGIVYCWDPGNRELLVDKFGLDGNHQETISVANPLEYIIGEPDEMVETKEFGISYPPSELGSVVIESGASAVIEVLHFDQSGNMIHDAIPPLGLIGCPVE